MSVREGTIFVRSKLPLLAWFEIVSALLVDPEMPLAELAQRVPVARRATLRKVRHRVRHALASPNAEKLLAGLPAYLSNHLLQVYQQQQISAERRRRKQNTLDATVRGLNPGQDSLYYEAPAVPATKPLPE